MKYVSLVVVSMMLVLSSLACCCFPFPVPTIEVPDIDLDLPEVEVGAMQSYEEEIPADGVTEAQVDIILGAGELSLAAGDPDVLLEGYFQTNVEEWAPEVTWENGNLRISQGNSEGFPNSSEMENEWDLSFSPDVPLEMDMEIGAIQGDLDFTGLAITDLFLDAGAGDLYIAFDAPNQAEMDEMRVRSGAAMLEIVGIGNASPEEVQVEAGVGQTTLDFSGAWTRSARVRVTSGTGMVVLRLPEDVGVRVQVEGGLSSVDTDGDWQRLGSDYVNEAYGESEIELIVEATLGMGALDLELVGE
ncbi:MAG: hypothetical protein JXD18_10315 [Anaerolineae bacterium]|nr:hypothetical protein [Anaerolineae bacterium]